MAVALNNLCSALATNAVATYYTAPVATRTRIDALAVTNTDASAQTISIWLVPSGGTAGDDNIIAKAKSIGAGETVRITAAVNQVLLAGGTLQAQGSIGSKLSIHASGVEVS